MRRVERSCRIVVLLGLGLYGCTPHRGSTVQQSAALPAQAADPASSFPNAPADLVAPLRVGRYARGAGKDYGSPEGGVSYDYSGRRTSLTVYFYARDSTLRALAANEALFQETGRFKQVLEIERQRGRWDAYEIAFEEPDSIKVGGTVLPGRQVAVIIRSGRAMYVSFYYLYAVGNEWIKVRGTVPVAEWQKTDIPIFARQVSAMAISPGDAP